MATVISPRLTGPSTTKGGDVASLPLPPNISPCPLTRFNDLLLDDEGKDDDVRLGPRELEYALHLGSTPYTFLGSAHRPKSVLWPGNCVYVVESGS